MTQDQLQLRMEFMRLTMLEDLASHFELLDYFNDCFIQIVINHHHDEVYTQVDADAKMILQMMTTKLTYLKIAMVGAPLMPNSDSTILDPAIIANMVRNIYEMVCLFNIIYIMPNSDEEKELIYKLWVISGLKYRQMHIKITTKDENRIKAADELLEINRLENEILNSTIYLNLDNKSKNLIKNCIDKKEFKIIFDENKVKKISWQYPATKFNEMYSTIYNYFSQYAHPTYISIIQHGQLYENGENGQMSFLNLRLALQFFSFFLADYIKAFPNTLNTFNQLPLTQQIALNSFNQGLRGDSYSINDCWKVLG